MKARPELAMPSPRSPHASRSRPPCSTRDMHETAATRFSTPIGHHELGSTGNPSASAPPTTRRPYSAPQQSCAASRARTQAGAARSRYRGEDMDVVTPANRPHAGILECVRLTGMPFPTGLRLLLLLPLRGE